MKHKFKLLALLLAILMLTACASPKATENSDGQAVEQDAETNNIPTSSVVLVEPEAGKTYEEYLSALTLFALSMEYPDFQLKEAYALSAFATANKDLSSGAYVIFESMGETLCAHVYPLEAERNEASTRDLYAAELGYAAFDILEELPSTEGLTLLDAAVYGQLLSELTTVSVFTH